MYDPKNLHYSQSQLLQLNRDLIHSIVSLPGVRSVSQASRGPIGGNRWVAVARADATSPPHSTGGGGKPPFCDSYLTPQYFFTLRASLFLRRPLSPPDPDRGVGGERVDIRGRRHI